MKKISFNKETDLGFQANEAYKTLRTNITFCGDEIKVILVTSTQPDEGKSSVVFQLVKSFAEDGKKVLLLDADLRKSMILGYYHVGEETKGLSHYLSGQAALNDVIYSTNVPNMNIIFAGPVSPGPSELLGSQRFKNLIESRRPEYDYIIVDTPPIGSVIDAAIIAKQADGVIIVVESGAISYQTAQKTKKQMELSGCRILGAVLNKVDEEHKEYYNGYYRKYGYRYEYGYGKSDKSKVRSVQNLDK